MNENEIVDKAMEWGKNENEVTDDERDFSKYGLGLKLASIAHCKRLTVISKGSDKKVNLRTLDLDKAEKTNNLFIVNEITDDLKVHVNELENKASGTTIVWQKIDKMYESEITNKRFAHRVKIQIRDKIKKHLEMTFGSFFPDITISMPMGKRHKSICKFWDPFLENYSQKKPTEHINDDGNTIKATFYILPKRTDFDEEYEYENAAGPTGKWLDRQGIYIYRKGRLIVPGGWHGLKYQNRILEPQDNFKNRIRIKIDYDGKNDSKWKLKVSKSEAIIPANIRKRLEQLLTKVIDEIKKSEKRIISFKDNIGNETPWIMKETNNQKKFLISREHNLIKKVRNSNNDKDEFELMLREIEKTVPSYFENNTFTDDNTKNRHMNAKIIAEFINLIKNENERNAKEKLKIKYPGNEDLIEGLNS